MKKYEIITKAIITKWFIVEAENEKEAIDKMAEPSQYHKDDDYIDWIEEIENE